MVAMVSDWELKIVFTKELFKIWLAQLVTSTRQTPSKLYTRLSQCSLYLVPQAPIWVLEDKGEGVIRISLPVKIDKELLWILIKKTIDELFYDKIGVDGKPGHDDIQGGKV